jgi:hypothetical protein
MNKYIKALSFRRTFARPEDAIDFLKQTVANRTDDPDDPYGLSTLQDNIYVKASAELPINAASTKERNAANTNLEMVLFFGDADLNPMA